MTDIRVRGFDSKRQLDQYFTERDSAPVEGELTEPLDAGEFRRSAETEMAWLRKEAAELRDSLLAIQGRRQDQPVLRRKRYRLVVITLAVGTVVGLAKFASNLRIG